MEPRELQRGFEKATSGTKRVLLVEGHTWFREALAHLLDQLPNPLVVRQASCLEDLPDDAASYDVILADPDSLLCRGGDPLARLREYSPDATLLALTGPDTGVRRFAPEGADVLLYKSASVQEIISYLKLSATSGAVGPGPV